MNRQVMETRHTLTLLLITPILLVIGCSRTELLYDNADWFLQRYADSYFKMNWQQRRDWRPVLAAQLTQHRREELPEVIAFLEDFEQSAGAGLDRDTAYCLVDRIEAIYRSHAELAVEVAVPLLAGLSEQQIDQMAQRFEELYFEYLETGRQQGKEGRAEERSQRIRKRVERWTGPLDENQVDLIKTAAIAMPDTFPAWPEYRLKQQTGLIQLLGDEAKPERIRDYLNRWWVEYRDITPCLEAAIARIRERGTTLLTEIDRALSPAQREQLVSTIGGLRKELSSLLETKPADASRETVSCSGPSPSVDRLQPATGSPGI
jgi:hypothetical protein